MIYFSFLFLSVYSVYQKLILGSIAYKLLNLNQTLQVAFFKLPTISFWNFLLTELMYLSQVCSPFPLN